MQKRGFPFGDLVFARCRVNDEYSPAILTKMFKKPTIYEVEFLDRRDKAYISESNVKILDQSGCREYKQQLREKIRLGPNNQRLNSILEAIERAEQQAVKIISFPQAQSKTINYLNQSYQQTDFALQSQYDEPISRSAIINNSHTDHIRSRIMSRSQSRYQINQRQLTLQKSFEKIKVRIKKNEERSGGGEGLGVKKRKVVDDLGQRQVIVINSNSSQRGDIGKQFEQQIVKSLKDKDVGFLDVKESVDKLINSHCIKETQTLFENVQNDGIDLQNSPLEHINIQNNRIVIQGTPLQPIKLDQIARLTSVYPQPQIILYPTTAATKHPIIEQKMPQPPSQQQQQLNLVIPHQINRIDQQTQGRQNQKDIFEMTKKPSPQQITIQILSSQIQEEVIDHKKREEANNPIYNLMSKQFTPQYNSDDDMMNVYTNIEPPANYPQLIKSLPLVEPQISQYASSTTIPFVKQCLLKMIKWIKGKMMDDALLLGFRERQLLIGIMKSEGLDVDGMLREGVIRLMMRFNRLFSGELTGSQRYRSQYYAQYLLMGVNLRYYLQWFRSQGNKAYLKQHHLQKEYSQLLQFVNQ